MFIIININPINIQIQNIEERCILSHAVCIKSIKPAKCGIFNIHAVAHTCTLSPVKSAHKRLSRLIYTLQFGTRRLFDQGIRLYMLEIDPTGAFEVTDVAGYFSGMASKIGRQAQPPPN